MSLTEVETKREPRGQPTSVRGSRVRGALGKRGNAGYENGEAEFILQNFRDDAFASNLMMKLVVPEAVSRMELDLGLSGFRIMPPADLPWGREVHFLDLAGFCGHVGEG